MATQVILAGRGAVHRARSPHARSPAAREPCWLTRCCMTRMCFSPSSMERSPCVYDDLIPHLCPWRLSLRRTLQRQSTSAPRRLINDVNIRRLLHVRRSGGHRAPAADGARARMIVSVQGRSSSKPPRWRLVAGHLGCRLEPNCGRIEAPTALLAPPSTSRPPTSAPASLDNLAHR